MKRAWIFALVFASSSCAGGDLATSLRTCFEMDTEGDPFAPTVSGRVVADDGFARVQGLCFEELAESFTLAQDDGARFRFSWEHPDFDLALPLSGDVEITELTTEFNGNSSFAVRDVDGLAAVFAPIGSFAPRRVPITVDHGSVTSTGSNSCGSFERTTLAVDADEDTIANVGESVPIVIGEVPFTFHAFASERATDGGCTDGGPHQSWAAFRD